MLAANINGRHVTPWYVLSCKAVSQLLIGHCGGACGGGKRCNFTIITVEQVSVHHAHFSPYIKLQNRHTFITAA